MKTFWFEFDVWDMGFEAHLTLHWIGEYKNKQLPLTNKALEWYDKNRFDRYLSYVKPREFAFLGPPEKQVPVIIVDVFDDLWKMKNEIEEIIPSASEFPWTPHITLEGLGQHSILIPPVIKIGPLKLQMSDD